MPEGGESADLVPELPWEKELNDFYLEFEYNANSSIVEITEEDVPMGKEAGPRGDFAQPDGWRWVIYAVGFSPRSTAAIPNIPIGNDIWMRMQLTYPGQAAQLEIGDRDAIATAIRVFDVSAQGGIVHDYPIWGDLAHPRTVYATSLEVNCLASANLVGIAGTFWTCHIVYGWDTIDLASMLAEMQSRGD